MTAGAAPALEAIAAVVGRIGTPALPAALDGLLRRVAPFDLSAIFGFPYDRSPLLLHDGYGAQATRAALDAYLRGAYLLDPFYTACVQGHPFGLWRMRELAPDEFFQSDFYGASEVHPCISLEPGSLVEEIGFLAPLPCGFTAAYSLMRQRGRSPFDDEEMQNLRAMEPLVQQILCSHWRQITPVAPPDRPDAALETAFGAFCRDRLTWQQQRIVQLILRGHSNASIGAVIGIAEGTVKVHRQGIYRRLGISSQSELFGLFIQSLLADRPG